MEHLYWGIGVIMMAPYGWLGVELWGRHQIPVNMRSICYWGFGPLFIWGIHVTSFQGVSRQKGVWSGVQFALAPLWNPVETIQTYCLLCWARHSKELDIARLRREPTAAEQKEYRRLRKIFRRKRA